MQRRTLMAERVTHIEVNPPYTCISWLEYRYDRKEESEFRSRGAYPASVKNLHSYGQR
jgi:hypothetical protein